MSRCSSDSSNPQNAESLSSGKHLCSRRDGRIRPSGRHGTVQSKPPAELRSAGRTNASAPRWFLLMTRLGLIAGNGKFPFLVLDAARAQGYEVVVAAIKEEAFPEIESKGAAAVHWLSLGELSKLIETFKREGVHRAMMAGQVKHKQIFSSIRPDWRLAKMLLNLRTR